LFMQDLPPQTIVSGLGQIGLLDADRINLQVTARLESEPEPPVVSYVPDFDTIHQRGAFIRPQIGRTARHSVGGPVAALVLGADADLLREGQTRVPLNGNYGVVYRLDADLHNPTPEPVAVALVMHALGGQARGTFLVGDLIVESPVVQPNAPQVLTTLRLGAQTRRTVRIETMPESGSNYPVRLTLGPP